MNTHGGYSKKTLTDVSVLLAGGGDKPFEDFIGSIQYNSTSKTLQYRNPYSDPQNPPSWLNIVTLGARAFDNTTYVTAVGNGSGNYINQLYYTKNGSNSYFTVNYATSTDYVKVKYSKGGNDPANSGAWSLIKNGSSNPITGRAQFWTVYNDGGPASYGEVLEILSYNSNHWLPQLFFEGGKSGHMYYRNKDYNTDSWGSWRTILDSGNSSISGGGSSLGSSLTVKICGVEKTLTIPSSIDWSQLTNKPSTYTPSSHNHDGRYMLIYGYVNNLDFNIADGGRASGIYYRNKDNATNTNAPTNYGLLTDFNSNAGHMQLYVPSGPLNKLQFRSYWWTDGSDFPGYPNWVTILHSGNSSVSGGGSTWGSSITVKINDVTKTLTIPSNPNTDYRVQQLETTTSNWRGVILGYNESSSANTGITGTVTNVVHTSNKLTFQPSTGILSSKGNIVATSTASSWLDGQRYNQGAYNLYDANDTGSYWPWMRQTNTGSSKWFSVGILNNSYYIMGSKTSKTDNGYDYCWRFDVSNGWAYGNFQNADTVDSQHFSYSNSSNSPTYLWGTNTSGTNFLVSRASMSVNYANSSGIATALLTNNSGQSANNCYDANPGLHFYRFNGTGNTIGGGDGWIMLWSWNLGSVGGQIYMDDNPSGIIGIRGCSGSSGTTPTGFSSWWRIYTDNYHPCADQIKTVTESGNDKRYLTFVDSNNTTAAYENLYTTGSIYYNPSTKSFGHGESVNANGTCSTAEGAETTATSYSHAEGVLTNASGDTSHAEGYLTTASGLFAHAEGASNTASGWCSHVGGNGSTSLGDQSFAQGNNANSSGWASFAANSNTVASGNCSTAFGQDTQALHNHEFAIGNYNVSDADTRFSVGGGTSDNRFNLFEVKTGGNAHVRSTLYATDVSITSSSISSGVTKFYVSDNNFIKYITLDNVKALLFGSASAVGSPAVPIYWTGSQFSTVQATFGNLSYGTHDANSITSNGMWYYSSNGPATSLGASTTDGALYSQAYSTSWVAQIAQDYRNGRLFVRGKNNGTWLNWRAILDSVNYTSYTVTKTGSGASGTWGINVTGSAASVPWTGVTSLMIGGNEFNIPDNGYANSSFWFNYYPRNNRSANSTELTDYNFGNLKAGKAYLNAKGYKRDGSSDSYVLLGGGGHKLITDLISSGNTGCLAYYSTSTKISSANSLKYTSNPGYLTVGDEAWISGNCIGFIDGMNIRFYDDDDANDPSDYPYIHDNISLFSGGYATIFDALQPIVISNDVRLVDPYSYGWKDLYTRNGTFKGTLSALNNKFYVNSSGAFWTSDIRAKKDIHQITKEEVDKLFSTSDGYLKGFTFKDNNIKSFGVIAQEIIEYCPECIDEGEMLHVNYDVALSKIMAGMYLKIKELEKEIEILKNR